MFIFIIVGLLIFSFLLALFSLWRDLKKNIRTEKVSEELSKGRVIFHAPTMPDITIHQDPQSTTIPDHTSEAPALPPSGGHEIAHSDQQENNIEKSLKEDSDVQVSISNLHQQQIPNSNIVIPHVVEQEPVHPNSNSVLVEETVGSESLSDTINHNKALPQEIEIKK